MAALHLSFEAVVTEEFVTVQGALPHDEPGPKRLDLTLIMTANKKGGSVVLQSALLLHGVAGANAFNRISVIPMPYRHDDSNTLHYEMVDYYDVADPAPAMLDLTLRRQIESEHDTFDGELQLHYLSAKVGPSDKTPLLDLTERVWQAD
jgi:hypothetical protein